MQVIELKKEDLTEDFYNSVLIMEYYDWGAMAYPGCAFFGTTDGKVYRLIYANEDPEREFRQVLKAGAQWKREGGEFGRTLFVHISIYDILMDELGKRYLHYSRWPNVLNAVIKRREFN